MPTSMAGMGKHGQKRTPGTTWERRRSWRGRRTGYGMHWWLYGRRGGSWRSSWGRPQVRRQRGGRVYVYINTVMDNIDTVSGSEISSISVYWWFLTLLLYGRKRKVSPNDWSLIKWIRTESKSNCPPYKLSLEVVLFYNEKLFVLFSPQSSQGQHEGLSCSVWDYCLCVSEMQTWESPPSTNSCLTWKTPVEQRRQRELTWSSASRRSRRTWRRVRQGVHWGHQWRLNPHWRSVYKISVVKEKKPVIICISIKNTWMFLCSFPVKRARTSTVTHYQWTVP